jgi:hypothetical protein
MRRAGLGLVAVTVIAIVALAVPAGAHHTDQTDPNDTEGRLDLEAVRFDHTGVPTWRLVTFPAWTLRAIWDRGYLVVQLDTKGNAAVDFVAVVRSDGRRLLARLFRLRRSGGQAEIASLRTDKSGSNAAWVSVPLREVSIGRNRTSYFWSALSSFTGGDCSRTCLDAVPDDGMIEQPLPGVTPTPTPSPSVAPEG